MSVFIEHTAGWFPFWIAPEQVRVLTVNNKVEKYVGEIRKALSTLVLNEPVSGNELRYAVDDSDDSLGKKIRRAVSMKVPVVLIVGEKDAKERKISVRLKDKEEVISLNRLTEYLGKL
jgi:threonyl-tRNA synthetase